jgi:hypothetical protein
MKTFDELEKKKTGLKVDEVIDVLQEHVEKSCAINAKQVIALLKKFRLSAEKKAIISSLAMKGEEMLNSVGETSAAEEYSSLWSNMI